MMVLFEIYQDDGYLLTPSHALLQPASFRAQSRRFNNHRNHLPCCERVWLMIEHGKEVSEDRRMTSNRNVYWSVSLSFFHLNEGLPHLSGAPVVPNSLSIARRIRICICSSVSRSSGFQSASSSEKPFSIPNSGNLFWIWLYAAQKNTSAMGCGLVLVISSPC